MNYIKDICIDENLEFLGLTETHLSSDVVDAEIAIDGYNILRQDRIGRTHGGVILYIKEKYKSIRFDPSD